MIPKDFDEDWSAEVSAHLSIETRVNIYPPSGGAVRLSLEILRFLGQNGLVSTCAHFIVPLKSSTEPFNRMRMNFSNCLPSVRGLWMTLDL